MEHVRETALRNRAILGSMILGGALFACSGSDAAPVTIDLPADAILPGSPGATPADASADAGSKTRPDTGAPTSTKTVDGGFDTGSAVVIDAGGGEVPTQPGPDGCTNESEPNNFRSAANKLGSGRAAFCGKISSSADQDYASYVLPSDVRGLFVGFDSQSGADAEVTVNGNTFRAGDKPIVIPGATYIVRVFASGKTPASYMIRLRPGMNLQELHHQRRPWRVYHHEVAFSRLVAPPLTLGLRYRALSLLAKGGMGAVYLGQELGDDPEMDPRLVAIKVMHGHVADNPEAIALFIDEARIGTRIVHPNVVRVLDADVGALTRNADDAPFIVMEYVEGLSWSRLLRRFAELGESVPADFVARIVHDTLLGLGAAHVVDAVHRDVSPQNILVGVDGRARITDFGVATFAGRISGTAPGGVRGKVGYMSPEQVTRSGVDGRADVFSAGIVLWEALTGRDLFTCETQAETLAKVLREPIAPPSSFADIGMDLEDLCLKALERDKSRRFQTANEFAAALAATIPLADPERVGEIVRRLGRDALDEQEQARAAATSACRHAPRLVLPNATAGEPETRMTRTTRGLIITAGAATLMVIGTLIGRASSRDVSRRIASDHAVTTEPSSYPSSAPVLSPADTVASVASSVSIAPPSTAAASPPKPPVRRSAFPRAHSTPAAAAPSSPPSQSRAKAPDDGRPFVPGEL